MAVTASNLRANIYRLLDQVLETGLPLEVVRRGRTLRIVPEQPKWGIDALDAHLDTIIGKPEELTHLDWSGEWKP